MKYNFDKILRRENTSSVKYDLRDMIFDNEDIIPMWVADMDFETPDFIINSLKKRLEHPILGYSFRNEEYFSSIINWQKKRHNWIINKDWIVFSPGIVPALNLSVMAFTNPGDKIIVQPPVYFPFFSAISANGRKQIDNPLKLINGRLTIDFDDLQNKIDKDVKMLMLCNPHNPGGSVWTKEELSRLAKICQNNDILILSDEIHCDLVYPDKTHIPIAMLNNEVSDSIITCIAPSKTFNIAGLSTSSIIISNEDLRKKFIDELDRVHVGNGNIFGNLASIAAYENGEEWLNQLLMYLKKNRDMLIQYFKDHIPSIKPILPESTYMVWLDCCKLNMPDDNLMDFFVKKAGIGFSPGNVFGKGGESYMRMNFACPESQLIKALDNIRKAVDTL